jgi:hypothetical protein
VHKYLNADQQGKCNKLNMFHMTDMLWIFDSMSSLI